MMALLCIVTSDEQGADFLTKAADGRSIAVSLTWYKLATMVLQ